MNHSGELRRGDVDSLEEGLHRPREQAERTPEGQFVRDVGDFSKHRSKEERMPTVAELDAAAPDTPVLIHLLYKGTRLDFEAIRFVGDARTTPSTPAAWSRRRTACPRGGSRPRLRGSRCAGR